MAPDRRAPVDDAPIAALIAATVAGLAAAWLPACLSSSELIPNVVKAQEVAPWHSWWLPEAFGGTPAAPYLTAIGMVPVLRLGAQFAAPLLVAKLYGLGCVALSGWACWAFLRAWAGLEGGALVGALVYMVGPQTSLQLGEEGHLGVVTSFVFAPLCLWALCALSRRAEPLEVCALALSSGGMVVCNTKMAVCFLPVGALFALTLAVAPGARARLGRGVARVVGLGLLLVVPLLPSFREREGLALFWGDPYDDWQRSFAFKLGLSWLDRGGVALGGLPPYIAGEHGGFYLGALALALLGWTAWTTRGAPLPAWDPLRVAVGGVLVSGWLSMGPRSVAGAAWECLAAASGRPLTEALMIAGLALQALLLGWLWGAAKRRWLLFAVSAAVFFVVPGFRLLEWVPLAQHIRAPWSLWQSGGTLAAAMLSGVTAERWLRTLGERRALALLGLLGLTVLDFWPYLSAYRARALPDGTAEGFQAAAEALRPLPPGGLYAVSERNAAIRLPLQTGRPLMDEAYDRYYATAWSARVHRAAARSPAALQTGLSLFGVRWLWVDRQDPQVPQAVQEGLARVFPPQWESPWVTLLSNPASLAPAFLAQDAVMMPVGAWRACAAASLALAQRGLLTVEHPQAGEVTTDAPLPLDPALQERQGRPFVVAPGLHAEAPDLIVGEVAAAAPAWVVLTTAYHPDWTAEVDGEPQPVRLAAGALLSVHVPRGTHQLRFAFAAPGWYDACLWSGLVFWLLLAGAALVLWRRRARP